MSSRLDPPSASSSARMSLSLRSSLSSRTPEASSTVTDHDEEKDQRPVITKQGRLYLNGGDGPFTYPLPVDLTETNRYIMLNLLTSAVFETPILSPELLRNPPRRVLEIGCDSGFWSAVCHQYFQSKGHQVSFIGIDMKPSTGTNECYKSMGMDWEYIQHDLREPGLPIEDGSIDLVMTRNMALAFSACDISQAFSEYVRVLRPGGTLEVWEHDFAVRSLRPQAQAQAEGNAELAHLGVYPVDKTNCPVPSVNPYVVDYNIWLKSILSDWGLTAFPSAMSVSTLVGCLVEGADELEGMINKRLAVPLTALKWERQDGQKRILTKAQAAIRQAALDSFLGMVEAFEPILRKSNRKNDDEWQEWLERAKRDWVQGNGLSLGECLEFGALSMKKKKD